MAKKKHSKEMLQAATKPKEETLMAKKKHSKEMLQATSKSEEETAPSNQTNSIKSINTSIFQSFQELTSEKDDVRLNAIFQLIQKLEKTDSEEKNKKELLYALKRLIRGCGASTNISRAGFFTGLVTFLKVYNKEKVSLEQIFNTLEKELSIGATITNKEDADAVVGRILICGALILSNSLENVEAKYLELTLNILIQTAKYRSYHNSLAYDFIVKLIEQLSEDKFSKQIWPILSKELNKPWQKQTLQTIHCLIAIQNKFPKILNEKYFSTHFEGKQLLNKKSYQHLYRIFWINNNTQIITHPAFEVFGIYIANNSKLIDFWQKTIDPALEQPTKLLEVVSLKIATDILNNITNKDQRVVDLLTKNFIKMLVEGLKTQKQKKDETLKAFYNEFIEALVAATEKLNNDENKVAIIRRLIISPGIFDIEKYTNTRIIHQMINFIEINGVFELFELFKDVFMGVMLKNAEKSEEQWLNFERINAGYMLQHLLNHKAVSNAYSWREKQLKFLFTVGIFHVNDKIEITKKENASSFSTEYGAQCKNMFYSSLQIKLSDLKEEKQMLYNLVELCNEKMQQKNIINYLRIKSLNDDSLAVWSQMISALEMAKKFKKVDDKSNAALENLNLVFHILLLNMGLLLFHDAEMAAPTIKDLMICMTRIKLQQKSIENSKSKSVENDDEPKWIEVVVDLLLHLLSQNSVALRNIVNAIFPHLCDSLTPNALHHMFSVLDMNDGANPLSYGIESDEDDDDEEDNNNEEEKEADNTSDEADDDVSNDDDDDDDDEDDEDDDEDDEDEDEDAATNNDKLRNAVSQALIDSNMNDDSDNDDMCSIDLNDLSEEQGQLLDKALANAFKNMKKPHTGGGNIKKTKRYRIKTTTVMHFRIRVLDLLEIYLQQKPQLFMVIDTMQTLFNMLENCTSEELKPLQNKITKVLNKLTTQKLYRSDDDKSKLTEENFVTYIREMAEKKISAPAYELSNKLRNKCIIFLINNLHIIHAEKSEVLSVCQEYLLEFIKSRNAIINITLFIEIFKLRWDGVWKLALTLTKIGLATTTRVFRRIQAIELLILLYKNYELQKQNTDVTRTKLSKIETELNAYIKLLSNIENEKRSAKEFQTLVEFLFIAHKTNQRLNLTSKLICMETHEAIQSIRKTLRLDSNNTYQRYCNEFKLKVIRNNEVIKKVAETNVKLQNGTTELPDEMDEKMNDVKENGFNNQNGEISKLQKRKLKNDGNSLKSKKLKKQKNQ